MKNIILFSLFLFTSLFASAATYPPDEQYSPVPVPNLARPGYLVPVQDSVTGATIIRITDAAAFGARDVRHGYPLRQPWNVDQTLILLDGFANPKRWILDASTYEILRTIPVLPDIRWSSTDPNKLYGVSGNKFVTIDAITGAMTTLRTFSGYNEILIGPYKGNLSIGDKYVAFQADERAVIVYDISTDTVIADKSFASLGYSGRVHWLGMSQSGNYVVISNHSISSSHDRNLNKIATLLPGRHLRHGDLGYDASGNEVYVQVCPVDMVRLSDGQTTKLFSNECGHLSTRNYKRPGWAYINFNDGRPQDVLAFRLDGSKIVERFTHHRSSQATYTAQAHTAASPDGTKVMFASDWNGTSEINSYVAEWPQEANTSP